MKKILVLIIILGFVAQAVAADSIFQPQYLEYKTNKTIGIILTVAGSVLAIIGLVLVSPPDDGSGSYSDTLVEGFIAAGAGGGMAGGGSAVWYIAQKNIDRMELAMENERSFTHREKNAILEKTIFIGMSNLALLASYGSPQDVNISTGSWGTHKQYVYGYEYVYVENGVVTSWQN
jgi:hypothetical protein